MLSDENLRQTHRPHVDSLIDELTAIRGEQTWDTDSVLRVLKATTALKSLLATSGIGECRQDVPFSEMAPIYEADGTFHWCCRHNPPHCHP